MSKGQKFEPPQPVYEKIMALAKQRVPSRKIEKELLKDGISISYSTIARMTRSKRERALMLTLPELSFLKSILIGSGKKGLLGKVKKLLGNWVAK